jgi:hypothetical protein
LVLPISTAITVVSRDTPILICLSIDELKMS